MAGYGCVQGRPARPEINANIREAQMVPPIECDLG